MSEIENNQRTPVDLIIESRFIATVDNNNALLEYHAVVVHMGKILAISPIEKSRQQYVATETVVLDHHVLAPGFINLHTHAAMSLMRGLADDVALMPWLNAHIWPAEQAVVSSAYVKDATRLACAEMLSGGTTCFNDMYFYPDATAAVVDEVGIRAHLGLVVLDFATPYATDAEDYLQKGFSIRDTLRGQPRITFSIAPHAPYTVSNQTFEKVMTYAEQLSIGIHTHLHETRDELIKSLDAFGMRPIKRLHELGVLGPGLVAAHCVHLEDDEIEMLNQYGCHIAHCPTSNLKLGSGIAPIHQALQASINIGLGTDGVASNNRLDMFSEMRLAALLAKGVSEDATVLTAQQALRMATINGAKALGLEASIGSIEVNKHADLIAVNLNDMTTAPCYDPISHLVYVCGREQVSHTWVGGELRYANGVYSHIEPNELKAIIRQWQPKVGIYKK